MEEDNINENKPYIIYKYNKKIFVIIRDEIIEEKKFDFNFSKEDIDNNIITLVIDVDNLSIKYDYESLPKISNIIENLFFQKWDKDKVPLNFNIIIRNTLVDQNVNNIFPDDLIINELNISDELYRMTPNLYKIFLNINSKKLVLKKIKINSKNQLDNVFDFILNTNCEELILEDIFIDLIIKEDNDNYNILNKYFFKKNNKIYIKNLKKDEKETKTKIKKIKMVDCPLFAITEETFIDVNEDYSIDIDIDENSLLNPSMITKFIINGQFLNIYFDLDSYKLSNEKDYIEYLDELFNKLFEIKHLFNKLVFKNFDTTKYEYITGDNLTFIDEKNWVLNSQEKKKKK